MNAISNYTFHESYNVRVQLINGEPWFCLADVCNVLSVDRTSRLLRDLDEKGLADCHTLTNGGNQKIKFVNEPNLYRVIFRSNKSEAKQFQDWVFNEVLPLIRKTGKYDLQQAEPSVKPILADKDQLKKIEHLIHAISHKFTHKDSAAQQLFNRLRVDLNLKNFHDIQKYQANKAVQILEHLEKIGNAYQTWRIQVDIDAINLIIRDDRPWTPTVAGKIRKELDLQISQHPDWRKLAALVNTTIKIGAQ